MRILFFLLLFLAFGFFLQQTSSDMGEVIIRWYGYEVMMPANLLCAAMALALLIFFFGGQFWAYLAYLPKHLERWRDKKRYEQGFQSLLEGMEAVSVGDSKQALKASSKVQKLLPDERLTHLLAGQSAALDDQNVKAITHYEELSEQEGGQFLGLKGLIEEYKKQGDWMKVRDYASQAYAMKPKSTFAVQNYFDALLYTNSLNQALEMLPVVQKHGDYTSEKLDEIEAFIYLEQSENVEGKEQVKLLEQSAKAIPHNIPALAKLVGTYSSEEDLKQALKFINKSFKDTPNPALYEAWVELIKNEPKKLYKRRLSALIKGQEETIEGLYIQALECVRLGEKLKAFDTVQKARKIEDCRQLKQLWLRVTHLLGQRNYNMEKALKELEGLKPYIFKGDDVLKAYENWQNRDIQTEVPVAMPAPKRAFGLLPAKKG